ncbi:MAG: leucine-rich repeat protein, partial [Clostridia bacterium]|nr:leucine-rich repeat protein [Clostridia bacterium]
ARAFSGCSGLTSIEIPSSVTSIGDEAFDSCSSLTSITIPSSVTSIGDQAFWGCSGLTSVTFAEGSQCTSIGIQAFYNCSGLTSITIPSSVTSIGDWAFEDCSGLTSITIPSSVTSIEWGTFNYCSGLTSITILNPDCNIYDSRYTISDTATIYGYAGSTAQAYAEEYGRPFVALGAPVHARTPIAAVAPTAAAAGNNAYYYCADCGRYFKDAEGAIETTPEAEIIPKLSPVTCEMANGDITLPGGSAITAVEEESVTSGDAFDAIAARAVDKTFEMHSVTYTGAEALDCTADFTLDLPTGMDAASVKVYRIAGDFIADLSAAVGEDGKLHFAADHLDSYVICEGELVKYGDATGDGKITLTDSLRLFRNMVDDSVSMDIAAADFSGDEQISLIDALMILRCALSQ